MDIFSILSALGGLAMFLFGINVMGDGLKKTSGGKLESILEKLTSNKIMAVLIGALVTAVMQSSSATTVMIVGFVNSGLMELGRSVFVTLGANIGATITPWIMSLSSLGSGTSSIVLQLLKPTSFAPVLAIIGVFYIIISKNEKNKHIARIMVGFAILMFGMSTMSDAVAPLKESKTFADVMLMFSNPILGTLVGLLLTAIIQSSSATIGMIQVFSTSGILTYGTAIPLMIGANIGTCATALLSSIGTSRKAKRAALIHFFYNLVRGILFIAIFYSIDYFLRFPILGEKASAVGIAAFDTCLSIASAIVLFPAAGFFEKLVCLVLPVKEEETEKKGKEARLEIKLLDERFLSSPGLAIKQCMKAANDMAEYTKDALFMAINQLSDYKDKKDKKIKDLEDVVDHYEDELGSYLVKISSHAMSTEASEDLSLILHSIGDFERISDHACNIAESAREMHDKEMGFSKKALEEMNIFTMAIEDIVNATFEAFRTGDRSLAAEIEPMEEVIDEINNEIKKRHVKRLRKGKCSIEMGFVLSDISTNYERISDHCSNIALSILQKEDEVGSHEYQSLITAKNNEEYVRKVKFYTNKYKLPEKQDAESKQINE